MANGSVFNMIVISLVLVLAASCKKKDQHQVNDNSCWQNTVGASEFPKKENFFYVNDYIDPAGTNNHTHAIQTANDECSAAGGGIVGFKPGTYRLGSVYIKNHVNFFVDEGVSLLGIPHESAYDLIDTRVAGVEMEWPAAMINFIDVKNAALTGKGTINGQGKYFWDKFNAMRPDYEARQLRWAVDYDCQRPRLILAQNSTDVTIEGVRLEEPGFWTVHILYSDRITVDGISIRNNLVGKGPSTDGIDIDSSTRVLIQNCYIDCNDDNFCLKAGKDGDGLRVNRPTEYVLIRNCTSGAGGGLITFGSETSGGIRYVEAHHLKAQGTRTGIRLKSAKTRGGVVEHIFIHNIELIDVEIPISGSLDWHPKYSYAIIPEGTKQIPKHWKALTVPVPEGMGIPTFRFIKIENMKATGAKTAIDVVGLEESPIESVEFVNVDIKAENGGRMRHVSGLDISGLKISANDNVPLKIDETGTIEVKL
jgi:hypothetical protein